ncbi:hypothetical protein JW707_01860 [Candidatus Woesearchaeota archaeon]|nr:hypothetical protein [Candidatus Woesearchaeota archaeon]
MVSTKDSYSEKFIFSYSIEHLLKKDKIRFYYALKGRDGKSGVAKKFKIEQLGRAVLFVDAKFEKDVSEFLEYWKCKFEKRRVLAENERR